MFSILNGLKEKLSQRKKYNRLRKVMARQNVSLMLPCYIFNESNLICQDYIHIGSGSWMSLFGKLYIDRGTIIGPRVKIHTANHNYEGNMLPYDENVLVKDIHIGPNVWIGADVTILPGCVIGEGAIIGACSCVTKDIPPLAIVGGNPARILKYRDSELYYQNKSDNNIYLKKKKTGAINIRIRRIG